MKNIKNFILEKFTAWESVYGILGMAAVVAVAVKFLVFYDLMGVRSNLAAVYVVSLLFTYLLFKMFRNKTAAAAVFFLLSLLMFCDVTYNSFFNRYLSVQLLGAAEVVGDIGESIREVMRPVNFLMLIDAVIVYAAVRRPSVSFLSKAEERLRGLLPGISAPAERSGKRARLVSAGCLVLLMLLLIANPTGGTLCKSIVNQEFFSYHVKDIVSVFAGEKEGSLQAWTDSYQSECRGELFGAAEGKNVVLIQMESFQNFVIGREYNGQELTPNLNRLIEGNSTYFDNFYQQIASGNTSDAEFAVNNSLCGTITSYTYKLYNENYYRGLPILLKERGYTTSVFHAYERKEFWSREDMYPAEGFDRFYGGLKANGGDYEMTDWMGWGLVDSEFVKQTVEYMKEIEEPYYNFVITLSNHHPYKMSEKYSLIELLPEDEDTIVGNYLQSVAYTDYSIGLLFEELKKADMYEDTIFVLYGDHAGMTHSEEIDEGMERLLGYEYDYQDMMNVPLIIHMPDESYDLHRTVSTAGGQTDVLPTLAYLLGFDELDTIYVGHNLYSIKEGIVPQQIMMTKGSFFSNDIAYEMSRDGVFENGRAWNIHTGEPVDVSLCYEGYLKSLQIIETSEYVLRTDAIKRIFVEGGDERDMSDVDFSRIYPDTIVAAGYPEKSLLKRNTEKALDETAYAGYKDIMLEVRWDDNGDLRSYNSISGRYEMSGEEIVEWMAGHGNINLYFSIDEGGDRLMEYLTERNKVIGDRAVIIAPSTEEYSGKYEAVLNISETELTAGDAEKFAEEKSVWAFAVTEADADKRYAELLKGTIPVYVWSEKTGTMERSD